MAKRIVIDKEEDGRFVVDEPSRPGSPPVGRGRTMEEALGNWLITNQYGLDIVIDVTEAVEPTEQARRKRELAKR